METRLLDMQVLWLEAFQGFQVEFTREMLLHGYALKRRLEGGESADRLAALMGTSGRFDFEGFLKGTNDLLIRFGRRVEEGLTALSERGDASGAEDTGRSEARDNGQERYRRIAQIKP